MKSKAIVRLIYTFESTQEERTVIGDGLTVYVHSTLKCKDYKHSHEIAQQITALMWGLA